ncbi:MAG: sodium/glutamate symporter [Desulfatiglandaceae bacterium]
MAFTPWAFLLDFCWMGLLLCIGKILRAKLKVIQSLYLPSSIVAGLLGLIFGSQFLNLIPFSDQLLRYPALLVILLFASFPFSSPAFQSPKTVIHKAGSMFFFNMGAEIGMFGISLLLGAGILSLFFPDVRPAFTLLMPTGFVGGHGYAAAVAAELQSEFGFDGALTIGYTFATVGIVSSVVMGIPLIKWAAAKGITRFITDVGGLPQSMRTGLIPPEERGSLGTQTISPSSLDPLTFHLMLILIATLGGHYVAVFSGYATGKVFHEHLLVPHVATAMICGLILKRIMNLLHMGDAYIDRQVMTRIGSSITDFLVGFGIASLQLSVVLTYIRPLIIMCILGWVINLVYLFYFAPRMNPVFWFERGIFTFGWCTGMIAMGIALLRIVDPDYDSRTQEEYGLAYIFISPVEILMISFLPMVVGLGYIWPTALVLTGAFIVIMILSKVCGYWSSHYPFVGTREGEDDYQRQTLEQN